LFREYNQNYLLRKSTRSPPEPNRPELVGSITISISALRLYRKSFKFSCVERRCCL